MGYFFGEDDKDILNAEVTPMEAVRYLGLETKKMGSDTYSILCPDPSHHDTHFGSCMITKEGHRCKCYVCDRAFKASEILELVQGCSFYDAMCQMAELSGHPEDFVASGVQDVKKKEKKEKLPAWEDRKLLGIAGKCRKKSRKGSLDSMPGYGDMLRELMRDDPQAYAWMVQLKCEEKIISAARIICGLDRLLPAAAGAEDIPDGTFLNLYLFRTAWNQTFLDLCRIYVRAGGKLKNTREMAGHINKECRNFRQKEVK